jgi:hypothetical protein
MTMAAAALGGSQWTAGLKNEEPAPPERFVVTTHAGMRFTGAAARVEIQPLDTARAPEIEVVLSAADSLGRTWAVQLMAPSDFLNTLTLSARVVDGPLQPGTANVQTSLPGADASFAPSGLLRLRLQAGWLVGEARGMTDEFSAEFEGPFVVTCAVPAASMAVGAPAPTSENALPTLIVDERFESTLCKPYKALAGRSR